ncbi:PIR Superfamily Protein [Plasmodium ovale wallikeri]|uniref:PIR Superfamily Protein n=1 Tax=Plasmodium ovale wallikeri TaxID=864142 RepID=A0A1A9AR19_PLAOA|nr:PIR Superfamily Protein [Plasmodium ovale wallikeri]SBT59142.1 PIR Superfamily Protein [Plasmodium ovale wallikeri]
MFTNKINHTIAKNEILKDFYTKFENMCSSDNNQEYCEMQDGKYGDYSDVEKLYYKFNGNKAKYELENQEFATLFRYPIRFCNYLKYWLYHRIIFYKFDKEKITEVLKKFKNGDKFQLVIGNNYTCNFNTLELEKIKNIKLFYDYIGSYDTQEKKSSIQDKICHIDYEDTINKIIDLYNDRNEYCANKSNPYCNEFDECKETYNIHALCRLQCKRDSYSMDEAKSVCSKVNKYEQDPTLSYGSGEIFHQQSTPIPGENPSIGITATVLPILAVLFVIFLILYNLTPFGTWLHKSIMKTKNVLLNPNENSNDALFDHASELDNVNLMEKTRYIAYHSS